MGARGLEGVPQCDKMDMRLTSHLSVTDKCEIGLIFVIDGKLGEGGFGRSPTEPL